MDKRILGLDTDSEGQIPSFEVPRLRSHTPKEGTRD